MVATAPDLKEAKVRPSAAQKRIIDRWCQLPDAYLESDVSANLLIPIFEELGVRFDQRKITPAIAPRLRPDLLVYGDTNDPPILAVELKKRVPELANAPDEAFCEQVAQNRCYTDAVGYTDNGIQQYLNIDVVKPEFLASYGLVFNGDFFQLWRRVDGLIFPLTPIQRVTKASIPTLMQQLAYCLQNPQPALVTTVWNRKGGVAKTTNTLNIGATLALKGKKVLFIDLDPQGDLTRGLGLGAQDLPNYLLPCIDKLDLKEADAAKAILESCIQTRTFPTTDGQKYDLAVLATERVFLEAFRDRDSKRGFSAVPSVIIKQIVQLLKSDYDYIFADVSPSPDPLTQGVLHSSDMVLIPSDLGSKSLHHATELYDSIVPKMREIRAKHERLHLGPWNLGIVFSNCPSDAGGLEKAVEDDLQKRGFAGKLCEPKLKTYAQTKIAEFKGAPVACWQNSPITKQFAELTNNLFLNHNFTDH